MSVSLRFINEGKGVFSVIKGNVIDNHSMVIIKLDLSLFIRSLFGSIKTWLFIFDWFFKNVVLHLS